MNNCFNATQKILDLLAIKKTSSFLKDSLYSHPDYPSLLSVSDTLSKYSIENMAVKISATKLTEVPLPCLVQIRNNSSRAPLFYTLKSFNTKNLSFYDESNNLIKAKTTEFLKDWTGICLLVEKSEKSKEPGIENKIAKKKTISVLVVFISLILAFSLIFRFNTNYQSVLYTTFLNNVIYFLLTMSGLIMGSLLLWYEVDKHNPTLQNICSKGKKVNCDYVLNSKYSKLFFGLFSVSSFVFAYFFASTFFFVLTSFSYYGFVFLKVLSFVSIPLILYSFYLQAFVIKKWCSFCILIQTILIFQCLLFVFADTPVGTIILRDVVLFTFLFLIPILTWSFLKPMINKQKTTNLYKRSLQKIKNNEQVFKSLLSKSDKIETDLSGLGIFLKNENAKYNVVKVCNPYCGPCAKSHHILHELYEMEIINLQVLFMSTQLKKNKSYQAVSHLLAIDAGDNSNTINALDDWYSAKVKDYVSFSNQYQIEEKDLNQDTKIDAMLDWCKKEEIMYTPTIFINGYKLPKEYDFNDLKEVLT